MYGIHSENQQLGAGESGAPELTQDEIDAEILAVSRNPANWKRLKSISAELCGGILGWTTDDLLQEVLSRFLEGRRRWPRNVHPIVVLKNAMRSVASDARKQNKLSPVDETLKLATGANDVDDSDTRAEVHGISSLTPEDEVSGRQQLAAVYAAVKGNEELELLTMVWSDGARGAEAAKELEWDMLKYEAARKRLVRILDAISPERRQK